MRVHEKESSADDGERDLRLELPELHPVSERCTQVEAEGGRDPVERALVERSQEYTFERDARPEWPCAAPRSAEAERSGWGVQGDGARHATRPWPTAVAFRGDRSRAAAERVVDSSKSSSPKRTVTP